MDLRYLSLRFQKVGREVFQARTSVGQKGCAYRPLNITPTKCVSPRADQIDHLLDRAFDSRTTKDSASQRCSINNAEIAEAIEYLQEIRGGHEDGSAKSHHRGILLVIDLCRGAEDLKPFCPCPPPKGRLPLVHFEDQYGQGSSARLLGCADSGHHLIDRRSQPMQALLHPQGKVATPALGGTRGRQGLTSRRRVEPKNDHIS